jgi:hypothetical protein
MDVSDTTPDDECAGWTEQATLSNSNAKPNSIANQCRANKANCGDTNPNNETVGWTHQATRNRPNSWLDSVADQRAKEHYEADTWANQTAHSNPDSLSNQKKSNDITVVDTKAHYESDNRAHERTLISTNSTPKFFATHRKSN